MDLKKEIEFKTRDGLTLRGTLSLTTEPNAPGLVIFNPLGTVKNHVADITAAQFNKSGFVTLTYDNRSFGNSDGRPRQNVDFNKQVDDAFDAVTFLSRLTPQVDPNRIALQGTGHGGGVAIRATAVDNRIKAVIAQLPGLSGAQDAQLYPDGLLNRAQIAAAESTFKQQDDDVEYVPEFPSSQEEALADPKSTIIGGTGGFGFMNMVQGFAAGTEYKWENKLTLRSAYDNYCQEFQGYLSRITPRPLLYISPSGDMFPAEPHEKAFAMASSPKEFVKLEPFDFGAYVNCSGSQTIRIEIEFLKKHLQ